MNARLRSTKQADLVGNQVPSKSTTTKIDGAIDPSAMSKSKSKDLTIDSIAQKAGRQADIAGDGATKIATNVIGAIAAAAAEGIDGVASLGSTSMRRVLKERLGNAHRSNRGIQVEVGIREAIVDIELTVVYGFRIPEIAKTIRQRSGSDLLRYAGLLAREINIKVVAIEFPARLYERVP